MADTGIRPVIVPGASLPSQPWWPQLHFMIIDSYLTKDISAYPPTWTRLNTDPAKGAQGLANELGDRGYVIVLFNDGDDPVACSGVLPFRGENWVHDAGKKSDTELANGGAIQHEDSIVDWETCCFCVHPSQRGRRLGYRLVDELIASVIPRGGKRLLTNYVANETGDFWRKLGFEVIPGAGGMLPKGMKVDPEKEGLREDVHCNMGVKVLS